MGGDAMKEKVHWKFIKYRLFFLTLFLTACASFASAGAPPTVKIGLVAPFEGTHRALGYEALFAVKLALQERNQSSGLNGYRVELVALNDFDEPETAQAQAKALSADPDVLGVVGHLSSTTTAAAHPIYQSAGVAMSIPWLAVELPHNGGAVTLAADEAALISRLNTVRQGRGFEPAALLTSPELDAFPADAQALLLNAEAVKAGQIILAVRQANITLPLFGYADVGAPQVVQVAGEAANSLIFVSPGPAPQDIAGGEAFIQAYQALAGLPPGPRAVLVYDATHVLLDAVELAIRRQGRRPTRAEVQETIVAVQRQGLSGQIAFEAQGRRIDAPVWIYQIANGRYPGRLIDPP